jgi:Icc-related predicted phosphoesterase
VEINKPLRFIAISDTHGRHRSLKLPKGDAILHLGDITYQGDRCEVEDFLNWFSRLNYTYKIFIAGNHDFFMEKAKAAVLKKMIPDEVIYLRDNATEINGLHIWGSPVTPWFFNWAFNKRRGAPMKRHWDQIPANTDILMTHGPAYGILDMVINEQHVGCKDLLSKVMEIKPKVHLFGHIHESYGSFTTETTRFFNCCLLNESYELVHRPVVFDI